MWRRFRSVGGLLLVSALLLAACGGAKTAGGAVGGPTDAAGGGTQSEPAQVGAGGTSGGGATGEPIKVGAVFILSGASSGYGISQRAGVELAMADINAAGGINGRPVEVIFEDSQGSGDQAITAVRKLIDRDEVVAIIGPTLSTEMFSAGPVANDSGVPILGVSTTVPGITDIGEYVFRNSLPEAKVIPHTVARSVERFGIKRAAVLYANDDDVSRSGAEIFKAELQKNGVEIVDEATFSVKDTEFGPQITKVMASHPDAFFISTLYNSAALLMVQARQAGYTGHFIGGNGFNSPALIEVGRDAVEGAVVGSPWFVGRNDPRVQKFVSDHTAKMGKGPDQFAAQAYDGMMLIAEALKAAGSTDRDAVRNALAAIRDYEGVTGKFSFDENRDPVMTPNILQIRDGKYVELD